MTLNFHFLFKVCSGNGESIVKRIKLDESQHENGDKTSPTIASLFKSTGCRKNLKINMINDGSPDLNKSLSKKQPLTHQIKETGVDETSESAMNTDDSKMETQSTVINNKENYCITLD